MDHRGPPDELELLALADGGLDHDPSRKAEVEAILEDAPAARERVRAFRAQTEALRAAFGGRLDDPVPERLRAVLERPPRWRDGNGMRAAAALVLATLTGLGGWAIGHRDSGSWSVSTLIDQSYAQFTEGGVDGRAFPAVGAAATETRPLGWLAEEIAIRLKTPDLSPEGYALVDKRAVATGGDQIVRLDYASPDGRSFSLFIAPRWEPWPAGIAQAERDGVSLAYWLDGPLASSVVTRMPPAEARDLAEAVRSAMHAETTAPTLLEPEFPRPAGGGNGILADTVAPTTEAAPPQRVNGSDGGVVKQN